MKKKYLVKQPSNQQLLHSDYSLTNLHPHLQEHREHRIQNRGVKNIEKVRLKTEWPILQNQLSNIEWARSNQRSKLGRSLKKTESSLCNLRKGRYFIPSNKENCKQLKVNKSNRFTHNEYRSSEFVENFPKTKLDTTITHNRNSETKIMPRKSIPKTKTGNEKHRFCSPSTDLKFKQFQETLELKSIQIGNRRDKQRRQNRTTLESSQEEELKQLQLQVEDLIGSGTFGKVFSARLKGSNKIVALKRVQQDKKYKTRQLEIVKMLNSPFIVKVLGTFVTDEGKYEYLNIAMESYQRNFYQLLKSDTAISPIEMKCFIYQMLRGLFYLHSQAICHRDLKPQNMLVKDKQLVICDFGSAKILKAGQQNISYICSRCYRAPQLIFEATNYTTQIDMWSLGCILLQILNGRPLFIADSSLNHILEVIKILGTPTKDQVIGMNPNYELSEYDLPKIKAKSFKLFPKVDPNLIDLIQKIMKYSPSKRITAAQALAHHYFDELRDEKVFRNITPFKGLQSFFNFEKQNISPALREKLVPRWWRTQKK